MLQQLKQLANSSYRYPIALLLGFLQALAFDIDPSSQFIWLSPLASLISLFGFLLMLQSLPPKRAALFGYLFGLGFLGWGLNWIYISMAQFGGAPMSFALLANTAVIAYLALYWLVAAWLITKLGQSSTQRLLLAAPIIALLEWVRSVFVIGFPWLSIGYAWIEQPVAQWSQFGGVFVVTFLVILSVALLLLPRSLPRCRYVTPVALLMFLAIHGYPLKSTEHQQVNKTLTVALAQGNMPVITEYDDARMTQNLLKYLSLTDEILSTNQSINLLIWPESAIPYFYHDATDFLESVWEAQFTHHFDLITGIPHINAKTEAVYNAVLLQKYANNPNAQFYYKQHLLPFGEYLPFRAVFAFFKDYVDIPMSDFSRGQVVQQTFISNDISIAPSICFEAVFGDEIRQNARQAQVMLNISNDAWFGNSKAQPQHLNIARMRAIENQKFLIRATNDGRTAIVTPQGAIQESIPPFQSGYVTGIIKPNDQVTLYARYGDKPWILFFISCIALICLASPLKKHTHKITD